MFVHLVTAAIVVGIKELFEPLDKFKIILETPFHQSVHRHYLRFKRQKRMSLVMASITYFVDIHLLEGSLKDFEVLDVLVFQLGCELHLLHLD